MAVSAMVFNVARCPRLRASDSLDSSLTITYGRVIVKESITVFDGERYIA